MEFRCETCGNVGAPGGVLPGPDGGIVMVCASCGAKNEVGLTSTSTEHTTDEQSTSDQKTKQLATERARENAAIERAMRNKPEENLSETAFERLIPEAGDGFRCPKCIRLIEPDTKHCPHCGLDIDVGVRHEPEDGPWDKAPSGKEEQFEQAKLLWHVTRQDPTELNFEKFVDFTDEYELWDLQIRRLRWFLVDFPDDEIALGYLRKVADAFQSRVIIAQASSKARAQNFEDGAVRFRQKLIVGTAIFWAILVIVVTALFLKSC